MMLSAEQFNRSQFRNKRRAWILVYSLFFYIISIRSQLEDGIEDASKQDQSSPQTITPSTSPASNTPVSAPLIIPPSPTSNPLSRPDDTFRSRESSDQSDEVPIHQNDENIQPNSDANNLPTITAAQIAAAATPSPPSNSRYRPPLKPPSPRYDEKPGLSEGAIGGIVFASALGVVILITFLIMYFRRLEQSITRDKRKYREKMARRYNTGLDQNPKQFYLPETQLEPYEVC